MVRSTLLVIHHSPITDLHSGKGCRSVWGILENTTGEQRKNNRSKRIKEKNIMAKRNKKRTAKKQSLGVKVLKRIAVSVCAFVLIGSAYSLVQRFKKDDETSTVKTLVVQDYARCTLNDTTGQINEEDESGLSTLDFYNVDGLKITIAANATVEYQVNYYDADKAFLGVETLQKNYGDTEVSAAKEMGAVYVKIEIMPTADEDGVVSALEKSTYVSQLTVEVSTMTEETDSEQESEQS